MREVTRRRHRALIDVACIMTMFLPTGDGAAQGHVHDTPERLGAVTTLLLEGPHLILYHRGFLALTESQVTALHRLRRSLCAAEVEFVRRRDAGRARLSNAIAGAASAPGSGQRPEGADTSPGAIRSALNDVAAAEADWLGSLVQARREARLLLAAPQRAQVIDLRDHWLREATAMIEEAVRPGQRGHPGMQLPVRVPGMVVSETTLLPYCEALHGPSLHLSVPTR